jgi:predicted DNA-binding transcriptional regulator YafY
MGEHLILERYQWFDKQVRADKYPNATTLSRQFEINPKTAQRNIDFMRDRLLMPLEYIPGKKGYRYEF